MPPITLESMEAEPPIPEESTLKTSGQVPPEGASPAPAGPVQHWLALQPVGRSAPMPHAQVPTTALVWRAMFTWLASEG